MDQPTTSPAGEPPPPDRTSMAKFRTKLALDRTTLAWIRTALTMGTFGFGMIGFFRSLRERSPTPEAAHLHQAAIRFGVSLVVLGTLATAMAGVSHWFVLRRLRRDAPVTVGQWPLSIALALLLSVIGLVSLGTLLSR